MDKEQLDTIELTDENIESMVYTIRGQKVMLDYDLARIYGYETRNLNRQVKNNIDKFPRDFMFQLTSKETEQIMMCKNFTSSWGGTRKPPYAFTEQGVYMLMTVLKGELATKQSIALIRLFKKMKDYVANDNLIEYNKMLKLFQSVEKHDKNISMIKKDLKKVMDYFIDPSTYKRFLILNGERLEADIAYQQIYSLAKHTLLVIDDYIDMKTLELLKVCDKNVSIVICSDNKAKNKLTTTFINDFIKDTGLSIDFKESNNIFHDRYIIIDYGFDNEIIYHCGASSKDAGKKVTTIMKEECVESYHPLIEKILSQEKEDLVSFVENVSSTGAGKPSEKAKQIMRLYDDGLIDYETAESAIRRLHKK